MPVGMQLLNAHNDERERYESEQRRKHAEDDVNAMRLRHRHRVGNISSNETELSHRWRRRA